MLEHNNFFFSQIRLWTRTCLCHVSFSFYFLTSSYDFIIKNIIRKTKIKIHQKFMHFKSFNLRIKLTINKINFNKNKNNLFNLNVF